MNTQYNTILRMRNKVANTVKTSQLCVYVRLSITPAVHSSGHNTVVLSSSSSTRNSIRFRCSMLLFFSFFCKMHTRTMMMIQIMGHDQYIYKHFFCFFFGLFLCLFVFFLFLHIQEQKNFCVKRNEKEWKHYCFVRMKNQQ